MSNLERNNSPPKRKRLKIGKCKDVLIIVGLAIVLIVAIWRIFYTNDEPLESVAVMSESERKVSRILAEIDGVGDAEVMIYETEEGTQSVVVVCTGAKNLRVIMDVREAVSAALGTREKDVKVYLKKE
ncbi:MAG: hypothetical protein E7355_00315 [Clostridiales bacterium]|nr:hypothetical protein [Clostridiales bacterium]